MMDIDRAIRMQEGQLDEQLECGDITQEEYNQEMEMIHREARDVIQEEAERAYDEVMNRY